MIIFSRTVFHIDIPAAICLLYTSNTADLTSGALAAEGTGANEAGSSAASGDRVKITVWTENRHDLDYMNKIVEEFNNTNDHIEIEYVVQTENYVNLLSMAANSGQSRCV